MFQFCQGALVVDEVPEPVPFGDMPELLGQGLVAGVDQSESVQELLGRIEAQFQDEIACAL